MDLIPRRLLIVLFALLQCLAPLLHAHAGMVGQGVAGHAGVHLPNWDADASPHHPGPVCEDADHVLSLEAIGLGSSLEARQPGLPLDNSVQLAYLPFQDVSTAIPWVPRAFDGPPPLLTSRRTPLPCAPPRV